MTDDNDDTIASMMAEHANRGEPGPSRSRIAIWILQVGVVGLLAAAALLFFLKWMLSQQIGF
jgi:hypothetical protein